MKRPANRIGANSHLFSDSSSAPPSTYVKACEPSQSLHTQEPCKCTDHL